MLMANKSNKVKEQLKAKIGLEDLINQQSSPSVESQNSENGNELS